MSRSGRAWILLVALSVVAGTVAAGEDVHTRITGTGVSLVVPDRFVVSPALPGALWRRGGSSIQLAEVKAPAEFIQSSFTAERLEQKGMTLIRSERVEAAAGAGLLLHVSQTVRTTPFRKWIFVTGDTSHTLMITAATPASLVDELEEPMLGSVLSAQWDRDWRDAPKKPVAETEPASREPGRFSVEETPDLVYAGPREEADTVLLTKDGETDPGSASEPFLRVSRSTPELAISHLGAYANRLLAETQGTSKPLPDLEEDTTLAGMPAYEIIASAMADSGLVMIYQAIAFDGRQIYLIRGQVGVAQRDRYLPQFREIAKSLTVGN